jgi:aryl-alcohol dehydrogenase-like predicted oxidoreductase
MIELKQRQLGKSGLMVSPIGLGCGQFSGSSMPAYWNSPPQEEINEIVRVSLEGGINWFDTAEIYGFGRSLQSGETHAGSNMQFAVSH